MAQLTFSTWLYVQLPKNLQTGQSSDNALKFQSSLKERMRPNGQIIEVANTEMIYIQSCSIFTYQIIAKTRKA